MGGVKVRVVGGRKHRSRRVVFIEHPSGRKTKVNGVVSLHFKLPLLMEREKLLLLIGIDKYDGTVYPPLNNAVSDLHRFKRIMQERYGFTVFKELYNEDATRAQILDALDSLCFSTTKDADVIIYFAGHGGQHVTSSNGFWAPIDCKKPNDRIYNSNVYDLIEGMQARHILLISDSCFSGTFIIRTRDGEVDDLEIEQLEALPSRWVFVSGGEQKVGDGKPGKGSPFANRLYDFLQNNQTHKINAGIIFESVRRSVKSSTGQTPDAKQIERAGNEGGQMVFTLIPNRSGDIIKYIKPSFPIPTLPFDHYLARTVTYYEHQRDEVSYFFQSERGRSYLIDAIKTHRKIALLGSAGSGKSVELLHLGQTLRDSSDLYVPLYKKFNTYTGQDLADYIPERWNQVDPEALVILLDGLDEIQTQFFYTAVRNIIEFTEKNPAIRVIISCRTNFYELPSPTFSGTIQDFSVFTLNDISLKEIKTYATQKLNIDGQEFIQDVYDASFIDLVQKPYFLNLITQYYIKNGELLPDRTRILEEAILNYYVTDKEHYNTTGFPLNKPETFERLEKIAFIMEVMGKNFINDEELHKIFPIGQDFENCKFLPAFRRQDERDQWMFEHNNIQEFLAARVLSKTPLDKLLEIISVSSAGKPKVRPTWVNTISFFISVDNTPKSKDVLDWIILNDVEVIIRFEPDRVSKDRRIKIFKDIFEFYSDKQIWLSSNKFSDTELARFGYFDEVIEYLLGILQTKETPRITQLNAIRVLDNFKMSDFKKYAIEVKETLTELLENTKLSDYDTYFLLSALANLNFTDKTTLDLIIPKFRKHKNQYIRAGIYKLLLHSDFLDDYLDVLIEGFDLNKIDEPIEDRESVNLMDESFHLKGALQKINSPDALKQIWTLFTDEKTRSFYLSDYKEIIASLIENSIQLYKTDKTIYLYIRDFFLISEHSHIHDLPQLIKPFFEATQTIWGTFLCVWKSKEISGYEKQELLVILMSKELYGNFLTLYKDGELNNDDALLMHQILFLKDRTNPEFITYREELEVVAKEKFGFTLEIPKYPDWNEINKIKTQIAFDLLFNKEKLLEEAEKIFAKANKEILGQRDLFDFRSSQFDQLEDVFASSALDLLREFTYRDNEVTLQMVNEFMNDKVRFEHYQINQIYEFLHRSNKDNLEVSTPQLEFIINWCETMGYDTKILWYFIHRFDIQLSEEKVLNLTTYYDFSNEVKLEETGTIEQLEHFIAKKKLNERVIENLENGIRNSFAWLSNAGYAIRNGIRNAYKNILDYLQIVDENEYKFNEVLEFWFKKTKDAASMKVFIETVHSEVLRWKAIPLLYNSELERDFLIEYLKRYMNNPGNAIDYRFVAANYLMEMNNLGGLTFCAEYILDRRDPLFEYHHNLNRMPAFQNSEGLPLLMKLLHLGKQEEFQKDKFNSLESIVIDTLFNMGISSDDNLIAVRLAINNFITLYNKELDNLNFLHFTILRMEEQLNVKKSQNVTLIEAIGQWNSYIL